MNDPFWSPAARTRLGTATTLPDAAYEALAGAQMRRPATVTLAAPATGVADYLFRLFFAFKALLASQILEDFKTAGVRESPNLFRVAGFEKRWDGARWRRAASETYPFPSAQWACEASFTVHTADGTPFEFTAEVPVRAGTAATKDMDLDNDDRASGASAQGDAQTNDSSVSFWEVLSGSTEPARGARGLAMLVWLETSGGSSSTSSNTPVVVFQSCNIMRVKEVHRSNQNSTKNIQQDRVYNVTICATTQFAEWFDRAAPGLPSQLYLLDPRLVGAEAMLRVIEGIAVQASKEHRFADAEDRRGRLCIPAWAMHAASNSANLVAAATELVALPQMTAITLMGLCPPAILPNLLTEVCAGKAQLTAMHHHGDGGACTFTIQPLIHAGNPFTITSGASDLSATGVPTPYPAQQFAIMSALMRPLTLIVGPPGTGKTDTVGWALLLLCVNLCGSRSRQNDQIIILAHSNKALDQIVLRLLTLCDSTVNTGPPDDPGWMPRIARLGYRDSIDEEVFHRCSVEALIQAEQQRQKQRQRQPETHRELRSRILNEVDVVAMTCAGAALRRFGFIHHTRNIGAMVIEEAAKVTQPCMLAMLSYSPDRCIMIGDSMQLAPVVRSHFVRASTSLDLSLFERLQRMGVRPVQLDHQGRARPEVCNLYRWRYRRLLDLDVAKAASYRSASLMVAMDFIDVPNGRTDGEVCAEEGTSIATLVSMLVTEYGINIAKISVLTPYRAQRRHLESALQHVPVGHIATIDEFQGLQNEVIIISLTHRGRRPSSFLCDPRRVNVLTSRAKHAVYFVGRRATYEADTDQWGRVLGVVAQYQGVVGVPAMKGWYDSLCKYGLCIRAEAAIATVACAGSSENKIRIGAVLFARVKRVCAANQLSLKAEAATRVTGFLLRYVETSPETMQQIMSSSDDDFTATVHALVVKLC